MSLDVNIDMKVIMELYKAFRSNNYFKNIKNYEDLMSLNEVFDWKYFKECKLFISNILNNFFNITYKTPKHELYLNYFFNFLKGLDNFEDKEIKQKEKIITQCYFDNRLPLNIIENNLKSCNEAYLIDLKKDKAQIINQNQEVYNINKEGIEKIPKINDIALSHFKDFIQIGFSDIDSFKFISKIFLEKLLQTIRSIKGDLTDRSIAEILYGESNELVANSFAMLKSNKFRNPDSLIDENLLDKWVFNLKNEFSNKFYDFLNLINDYKLFWAKIRVFDLVNNWNTYREKIQNRGLNMETSLTNFIVSVLNGELVENMFFELSCKDPEHEKFKVPYKKLYRAICPNCSRILRSLYYQDYVNEAQIRGAKYKFSESEFMERINDELNKPREEQVKFSRILFPFICNKHGEFFTNKDRINEGHWCPDCYYDSRRFSYEQAVSRGKDYNFILETPKNDYEKFNDPSKQNLIWSCIYHPDYKVNSRPDEYNLDLVYCPICSGGQITNERILRYLFSRIFNKDYCEKPTLLIDILDFDIVKHLLPKDYNSLKSYSHMHFDVHINLNFIFNGKNYSLSIAGEYWDREHTSSEEYVDRFKNRNPRLGTLFEDYLHLKSSDNFKKELKNRKLIDILIIINHNLTRDDFQGFIIEEFESQFKEIFNEPNLKLRNFPRYNWRDLKIISRNRQIFGDIKRFT